MPFFISTFLYTFQDIFGLKPRFRDYVLSSLLLACMIIIATSADFMLLTHKLLIFCNEDFCQIANIYFIISRLWNPLRAIYITIYCTIHSTTQAWQHVVYNIYIYQWHVLLIFTLQMLHAHCLIYTAFSFELCKPWKKLMKEKSFVMQKPLINKNENMNFTRFSRMLFVLKKKYDC